MALITDKFTETFNGQNPTSTTVANARSIGGTSLICNSLAGWPTNTAVHFATYKKDATGAKVAGSQTDWKGIVSGSSINTLTRQGAAADAGNGVGDIVEMMPTYAWAQDLAVGLEAQHTELGAHKGITTDTITTTGNASVGGTLGVTGLATLASVAITANNNITAANLATNAITLGYAQITGAISTQATTATQATGLTSTVTVPAGGRKVKITLSGGYLAVGTNAKNIYLEIWSGTVGSGTRLGGTQFTQANANYAVPMSLIAVDTPSAGSVTYNVGYYTDAGPVTLTWNVSATSPAFILVEAV